MKRIFCVLLCVILTSMFCACATEETKHSAEQIVVSRLAETEAGKIYFEVDGKPFLYTGSQIRVDGFLDVEGWQIEDLEKLFKLAAELNVNSVQLPIRWRMIEPEKDVYDFRNVGIFLNYALKYDLKVEILLFTVNVCGSSSVAPYYVEDDAQTYPRYPSDIKDGSTYFYVQNNENLLERETKAVKNLMSAIAEWDKQNGNPHVVIGAQIHNEPDVFPLWRLNEKKVMTLDGSRRLTDIEAWEETLEALDVIGQVVQNSEYRVVTRVNTAKAWQDAWASFWPKIYELEGIDMVGDDLYNEAVSLVKEDIQNLQSGALKKNFPHLAENRGSYSSSPSLILSAVALGGGYLIYDLVTAKTYIEEWGWPDEGIIYSYDSEDEAKSLSDKPHTELTRNILGGMKKAGYELVLADVKDIAAFNVSGNFPETVVTQEINTSKLSVKFETESESIGFAVVRGNYVTVYTTSEAKLTFGNGTLGKAEKGMYATDGTWQSEGAAEIIDGTLMSEGKILYRIEITSFGNIMQSNTAEFIG